MRAVVRQAVRDVRTALPPPPTDPLADPTVAALRRVVDDLAASTHAIGELMLEVAPVYLSDTDAADVLAPLCEEIDEELDHGLAARRYATSGDRRALHGTMRPPRLRGRTPSDPSADEGRPGEGRAPTWGVDGARPARARTHRRGSGDRAADGTGLRDVPAPGRRPHGAQAAGVTDDGRRTVVLSLSSRVRAWEPVEKATDTAIQHALCRT
ncbi:hypothetical protein [Streptomyces sp. NPDC001948]